MRGIPTAILSDYFSHSAFPDERLNMKSAFSGNDITLARVTDFGLNTWLAAGDGLFSPPSGR